MCLSVCVLEAGGGRTTLSPGGSTTPPPVGPDVIVPVLGRCTPDLLCRDRNSHCVNGTCVCLSAYYHDPATQQCRQLLVIRILSEI